MSWQYDYNTGSRGGGGGGGGGGEERGRGGGYSNPAQDDTQWPQRRESYPREPQDNYDRSTRGQNPIAQSYPPIGMTDQGNSSYASQRQDYSISSSPLYTVQNSGSAYEEQYNKGSDTARGQHSGSSYRSDSGNYNRKDDETLNNERASDMQGYRDEQTLSYNRSSYDREADTGRGQQTGSSYKQQSSYSRGSDSRNYNREDNETGNNERASNMQDYRDEQTSSYERGADTDRGQHSGGTDQQPSSHIMFDTGSYDRKDDDVSWDNDEASHTQGYRKEQTLSYKRGADTGRGQPSGYNRDDDATWDNDRPSRTQDYREEQTSAYDRGADTDRGQPSGYNRNDDATWNNDIASHRKEQTSLSYERGADSGRGQHIRYNSDDASWDNDRPSRTQDYSDVQTSVCNRGADTGRGKHSYNRGSDTGNYNRKDEETGNNDRQGYNREEQTSSSYNRGADSDRGQRAGSMHNRGSESRNYNRTDDESWSNDGANHTMRDYREEEQTLSYNSGSNTDRGQHSGRGRHRGSPYEQQSSYDRGSERGNYNRKDNDSWKHDRANQTQGYREEQTPSYERGADTGRGQHSWYNDDNEHSSSHSNAHGSDKRGDEPYSSGHRGRNQTPFNWTNHNRAPRPTQIPGFDDADQLEEQEEQEGRNQYQSRPSVDAAQRDELIYDSMYTDTTSASHQGEPTTAVLNQNKKRKFKGPPNADVIARHTKKKRVYEGVRIVIFTLHL